MILKCNNRLKELTNGVWFITLRQLKKSIIFSLCSIFASFYSNNLITYKKECDYKKIFLSCNSRLIELFDGVWCLTLRQLWKIRCFSTTLDFRTVLFVIGSKLIEMVWFQKSCFPWKSKLIKLFENIRIITLWLFEKSLFFRLFSNFVPFIHNSLITQRMCMI